MQQLIHSIYGFTILAAGVTLPGLVNMTAVRVCLKRGVAAAMRFNLGAAAAVFIHAYIAIAFAGLLSRNPDVLVYLRQMVLWLFLTLSFVFFYQAIRKQAAKASKRKKSRPLLLGFLVSIVNVLNIPSVFAFGTYLRARGQLVFAAPYRFFFVLGAALGAFTMLTVYVAFAKRVNQNADGATFQRLNYFLSGLFLLLAFVQGVQLYYQ
ncbi:MAG: LysE family transporter [Bacteroidetes bacterium]|jgi:threonine/homoserine/homoserine lactone efflux protein|nr:LysE family transporter [Bacteroidota bacterium]